MSKHKIIFLTLISFLVHKNLSGQFKEELESSRLDLYYQLEEKTKQLEIWKKELSSLLTSQIQSTEEQPIVDPLTVPIIPIGNSEDKKNIKAKLKQYYLLDAKEDPDAELLRIYLKHILEKDTLTYVSKEIQDSLPTPEEKNIVIEAALEKRIRSLESQIEQSEDDILALQLGIKSLNKTIEQLIISSISSGQTKKQNITQTKSTNHDLKDIKRLKGFLPWPLQDAKIVKRFGPHPDPKLSGVTLTNNGIDLSSNLNTVSAIHDGTVFHIEKLGPNDQLIILEHYDSCYTVYAGLDKLSLKVKDQVSQGQTLGALNTAKVLHFEFWKGEQFQNPQHWLKNN